VVLRCSPASPHWTGAAWAGGYSSISTAMDVGRRRACGSGNASTRGKRWVTADGDGRYQVWGVSPWEEMLVSVDSTSLTSPWWTPAFPPRL